MDAWPAHCTGQDGVQNKGKGKGKAKDERVEGPWRYPVVEHGSLGAATLRKQGKRYEWTFVSEGKSDYQLVAEDGPVEVFPATRPKPWRGPKATELQRAEQGAHFLRAFYPDIDIQTELIRDEIAEDERAARALRRNDPYSGNTLAISSFNASRKNVAYAAFPMGETNCQLNLSPLVVNPRTKVDLKPVAKPAYTFDTPIKQIIASSHVEVGKGKPFPTLGVRTLGATTFMQVKVAINKTTFSVEPTPLVAVQRSDIGDRHSLDMAIAQEDPSIGYVVNEAGAIFRCSAPEGKKVVELVHVGGDSGRSGYRITAAGTRETLLFISDKSASLHDLRVGKRSHLFHTVAQPEVVLTSIENSSDDNIIRLVSSREILWIDGRNTRKPLLSIKHGRDFDTTLSTTTHTMISSPVTFLTSRRNSLITVYDVSRGSDSLVHIHNAPYALPPILRPDGAHSGYAFFQQPTLQGSKQLSIFQLSERGSMSLLNLQWLSREAVPETAAQPPRRAEWSPEVKKLRDDAEVSRPDLGTLAARTHSIVDLQPAYRRLFLNKRDEDLAKQTNAVLDALDRMPSFWQDTDVPIEHVLTTFDIAMRSGPEPADASRNDWFTGSVLDSTAGHRALGQGRIPRDQLIRRTPWHLDLSSFIRRTVPEFAEDHQRTLENLARYDLADSPDRTAPSYRRENEARSQLALDLTLASDVFAPKRPGKEAITSLEEDMANISRSTEAMSLGNLEPPPVHFSFLRPVRKAASAATKASGEEVAEPPARMLMPLGVRLLLQEWDVGTDPMQYEYRDPYDETAPPIPARVQRPAKAAFSQGTQPATESRPPTQTQTQRPPAIASSTPKAPPAIAASQPPQPRRPLVAARSQDTFLAPTSRPPPSGSQPVEALHGSQTLPPSSQEFMPSTQVLPGPHGGRPGPVKKKVAKKRLGGF
ncbi:hypothetical protein C8Q77DRAFT_1094359 [Trametes polyzona]|nr:hypothetical protein C8Q77DRAFT_1094359 [Trametes polyzona]